jgi:hypothetical protein
LLPAGCREPVSDAVRTHLASCPSCRQRLERLGGAGRLARRLPVLTDRGEASSASRRSRSIAPRANRARGAASAGAGALGRRSPSGGPPARRRGAVVRLPRPAPHPRSRRGDR